MLELGSPEGPPSELSKKESVEIEEVLTKTRGIKHHLRPSCNRSYFDSTHTAKNKYEFFLLRF